MDSPLPIVEMVDADIEIVELPPVVIEEPALILTNPLEEGVDHIASFPTMASAVMTDDGVLILRNK